MAYNHGKAEDVYKRQWQDAHPVPNTLIQQILSFASEQQLLTLSISIVSEVAQLPLQMCIRDRWKHMHQLSRYVDRLGRIMVENKRKVKILAVDPVTSVWTETDEQKKEKLKEDFGKLQNLMLENQLDYYIADADIIEDGAVKTKEEGTKFVILGEEYDIILLPPMTNMEDSTFKKIREYLEKGGRCV